MKPDSGKIEPILYLLMFGIVFFTGTVFVCEYFFKDDGALFQVFAGLLTGFSGAFFIRIKSKPSEDAKTPPPDSNGQGDTLSVGLEGSKRPQLKPSDAG